MQGALTASLPQKRRGDQSWRRRRPRVSVPQLLRLRWREGPLCVSGAVIPSGFFSTSDGGSFGLHLGAHSAPPSLSRADARSKEVD